MKPSVKVNKVDHSGALSAAIRKIGKAKVLVGIPEEKSLRKGSPINNASLLFVLSNGSPLQHIPPRPVLEPAIKKSKDLIVPELAAAAKSVMDNHPDAALQHLKRAGLIGANAAKRYFTEANGWPANAPSTIAKKGSRRPMIDTGEMRRSITYIVEE